MSINRDNHSNNIDCIHSDSNSCNELLERPLVYPSHIKYYHDCCYHQCISDDGATTHTNDNDDDDDDDKDGHELDCSSTYSPILLQSASTFLSCAFCDEILTVIDQHYSTSFTCEHDNLQQNYPQSTCDIEIDRCPLLKTCFRRIGLIEMMDRYYSDQFQKRINSLDDLFIVKYQCKDDNDKAAEINKEMPTSSSYQVELEDHIDAGDISFMIALSQRGVDYDGGGTSFRILNGDVIHLPKGGVLTFDAKLYHAGQTITRGCRYLLVGFCHVDDIVDADDSEREPATKKGRKAPELRGNLSKELELLY